MLPQIMKLIKKCEVELVNYYAYENELVILHPLMDKMVLESKTANSHHHHHHLPSSPHHGYGSLVHQVDPADDTYPLRPKSPQHHVVELPPSRTNVTRTPTPEHKPDTPEQQHEPEVEETTLSLNPAAVGSKAVGTMTSNQGLNDLYQRTPLLGSANSNGGPDWADVNSNGGVAKILFNSGEEERKKKGMGGGAGGGGIRIEMGGVGDNPKFPEEKWKTFIAFLILVFNLLLTTTSLAVVHEWVPDRKVYQPLPDIFLDAVPATDWTLYMSEILIMISTNVMVVVVLVHRHRFIILRRLFLMLALLYLMRSITMFVTVLPMSSRTYRCAEKANSTSPRLIASRVIQLFSGFGLSINGKHTFCGDYIYSGHTTILAMAYLMIHEYSPKRYFLLHWAAFVSAVLGVIMVLVAHGHYTVDVLIAYYITTRLFWVYHTLANNASLKQRTPYNYLSNVWWFRLFQYFEGNVGAPLPRQYETPLQILRKYTSYGHGTRDS